MNQERILIVEDDPAMQRLLVSQLTARGFAVRLVDNGPAALALVAAERPDLILLDITLPGGMDGLEFCRELRTWSSVPVILVTAADTPQTKVVALELGGDDYLIKPFHVGELVARIRAVLRRAAPASVPDREVIEAGDISIDLTSREVRRGAEPIHLTKIEFDLLRELVIHRDTVLTYEHLLESVWGPGSTDIRLVHVHSCNLRRKLEQGPTSPRHILAVPGVGYRFRSSSS
jgi:two-component system KDP operon response regulator KdpE